ncbi:MAG: hypothetical protein GTO16_13010 [Candidatus Aminicenantes bacterium]|nr:hypothetical protein [Candidatus Aminicenantes bacterium]
MKTRNLIIPVLLLGFTLSLFLATNLAGLNMAGIPQEEAARIPKEVKTVFEEGILTREARLDIPFSITNHLYLPARENMHSIFFFKVKNADLSFTPIGQTPATPEKKEEETEAPPEEQAVPTKLQCDSHIFLQVSRIEKNAPGEVVKQIYIPFNFQVDSSSYEPDKEELYTTAYPFPPGKYILSMAIASQDLSKIGTQYFEFSLPDPLSPHDGLDTTPVFFIKNIKRMSSPEIMAEVHKDFFTYSVLQIEANIDRVFSSKDNFEVFFYIFGAQPSETGRYDIEVGFEVYKGEELAIRFKPGKYEAPLVPQPLHLKQTLIITSGEEERTETRDLGPGEYTLSLKISDKVSGKSETKTIDFVVK